MEEQKKILVVDDNSVNLKLAEQTLKEFSKPVLVPSGKIALDYLEKNKPSLILLDIIMPEMNGYEVMEKLKANPLTSEIPVIFLTADLDAETEVKCLALGAMDFVRKPFEPAVLSNRVKHALEILEYRNNLEKLVHIKTAQLEHIQYEVIMSIANLIENRDNTTGQHVKRTSNYVSMIINSAKKTLYPELEDSYIYNVIRAAPLHDIGKISISDTILQKPGPLTNEEFEIMKKHTLIGANIIQDNFKDIEDPLYIKIATNVALYHHEKWNGQGYPKGLSEKEIPLEARIMAIADVFDALTTKRCYKKAFPVNDAFRILEESSGSHFDPELLKLFLQLRPEIEEMLNKSEVK